MYHVSQLNELLVPELLDIADQLNIPNNKKFTKQDLVNSILDKQSTMKSEKPGEGEKPKRKRIPKPSDSEKTAPLFEAPEVEAARKDLASRPKRAENEKKPPVKKYK